MNDEQKAAKNTDRELFREDRHDPLDKDNYYANHVFVTEAGSIGMGVGGSCIVMPISEWHKLTATVAGLEKELNGWRSFTTMIEPHFKGATGNWMTPQEAVKELSSIAGHHDEVIDERDALELELSALRASAAQKELMADSAAGLMKERDELRTRCERLALTLGFYSDPLNWENELVDIGVGGMPIPMSSPAAQDMGQRAHHTLVENISAMALARLATATATGAEK